MLWRVPNIWLHSTPLRRTHLGRIHLLFPLFSLAASRRAWLCGVRRCTPVCGATQHTFRHSLHCYLAAREGFWPIQLYSFGILVPQTALTLPDATTQSSGLKPLSLLQARHINCMWGCTLFHSTQTTTELMREAGEAAFRTESGLNLDWGLGLRLEARIREFDFLVTMQVRNKDRIRSQNLACSTYLRAYGPTQKVFRWVESKTD